MTGSKQVPMILKQSFYDKDPELLNKLKERIQSWMDSVPSGTGATMATIMNFGGYPSGMPVDTWMDGFNATEGISVQQQYGPLTEQSFGMPYVVRKH